MERLRILLVDDDVVMLQRISKSLTARLGHQAEFVQEADFERALSRLAEERFDVAILDVRKGDPNDPTPVGAEAGKACFEAIKQRRFIPVVFHTGLPSAVQELASPVVAIVWKGEAPNVLATQIEQLISSKLPAMVRGLTAHIEQVQRDYMWNFGAQAWNDHGLNHPKDFAHLLARRLALSFDAAPVDSLLDGLGHVAQRPDAGLNPVRMYVMPPLNQQVHLSGDIYEADGKFWVLLTPTCDLVTGGGRTCKAENPVLAACTLLSETSEFQLWKDDRSNKKLAGDLTVLLKNRRSSQPDRYFFLPAAFKLPDLVVDLGALQKMPYTDLLDSTKMQHLASLDTPFAAALLTKFLRYFGRFGTEDVDVNQVLGRLGEQSGGPSK